MTELEQLQTKIQKLEAEQETRKIDDAFQRLDQTGCRVTCESNFFGGLCMDGIERRLRLAERRNTLVPAIRGSC